MFFYERTEVKIIHNKSLKYTNHHFRLELNEECIRKAETVTSLNAGPFRDCPHFKILLNIYSWCMHVYIKHFSECEQILSN